MKKIAFFALVMLAQASVCHAALTLTDEQFDNIDIIQKELKAKDSNFIGMNGSKEKMEFIGISDKEAKKVIDKIDFTSKREELESQDPKKSARKTGIEKLKTVVGMTNEEIKALLGD